MKQLRVLRRALFLLTFLCAHALSQGTTGAILGNIEDSTGARVPGVGVIATNVLTGESHRATADAQGGYIFPVLPVGNYRVEAEASGFKKTVRDNIELSVNQNARVDLRLELGSVAEEIKVSGEAPVVDTHEVQVGGLVDTKRVNDLPLNGRNVYDLVATLPGVAATHFSTVSDNNGNYLNVNGSRSRHSTFMLDGAFNNDLWRNSGNSAPNPDAVQEFRLITSNFNAEYGRSPGAVFNVITKSGTNQLHGSLFEFLRNDVLNARNFFQPSVTQLRQNQYGFAVGGPVIHNKTFFFGSFQGLKIRSSSFVNSATPPTAAERLGDFSASKTKPKDPLTGVAFPNGIIPANRLDPVALNILKLSIPLPNTPDGRLEASAPNSNNEDQYLAKIDHQLTQSHKLYGSVFLINGNGYDPFPSSTQVPNYDPNITKYKQRNVVGNEDWIASPTILNQARFSYTRRGSELVGQGKTSWSDYGSPVALGALPARPPQLFINGRFQVGTFGASNFVQQTYAWSDTLNWVHNRHSIKMGGQALYNRYEETGNWLGSGQIRFNGSFTGLTLADFLIGDASSWRQNNGTDRHFRSTSWYTFVQDDWQISRRVTLNLGLRYELNLPFVSTTDALDSFGFGQQSKVIPSAPLGLLFPGDPGVPRSTIRTDWNNFAPRLGVSIDPFGNGKTAIRAGWGVFYAFDFANMTSDLQGQPFLVDTTVFGTPSLSNPYGNVPGGSPYPYKLDLAHPIFSLPISATYTDRNLATPYVQHYSFAIEQQLAGGFSLTTAYVGNSSRKLIFQRDANAPLFIPGKSTAANVNDRRPYLPGTYAQIAQTTSGSNAHYDSLQVTANKRFAHGFSILGSYTWSKSMDEISDDKFNPTAVALEDSNNRRLDRGPSDFNTPHVLVASYVWELPKVVRWGFVGRQILSGWQTNGIARIQSGNAFTVTSGADSNLDGNTSDRPNLVGDPHLSGSSSRDQLIAKSFNTAAFLVAPTGTDGNAGRNLLYGPGSINFNLSAFKIFYIRERHQIHFRAELFNAFNHTNLGNPTALLNNANFGRILSAGQPRIVQFALKYQF